jgi:regulator of protease activity HflC (stomatin/prohibitin superfamily)
LIALAVAMTAACGTVEPNAGQEAVLTRKPMFVGSGGVDNTPVKTGLKYVAWTTTATYVNMQPQRVDLAFDDMMTKTGVPVDFHLVVQYVVTDSVKLVKEFGADYTDKGEPLYFYRNLDQPFRTVVRDEIKNYDMQDIAINTSAITKATTNIQAELVKIVGQVGIPIRLTEVSLGRVNPPDAIKHQRIDTATQEQRIITEQQRRLAEDQRKLAEESRAAADAAYNYKMQLSPAQYLQLEEIKMQKEVCAKGGCYFGFSPTFTTSVK